MTFVLPHYQEHREEILSTITTAFTMEFIFPFHNHPEIFGLLGSLDVSLDDERHYIQYMIAKRTKSEAHSTASYDMEADTKGKM